MTKSVTSLRQFKEKKKQNITSLSSQFKMMSTTRRVRFEVSQKTFLSRGESILRRGTSGMERVSTRDRLVRFRGTFGIDPFECSVVWKLMAYFGLIPPHGTETHLLWALMFLKTYAIESFLSSIAEVSEKTYRKWVWFFVYKLSCLEP